MPSPRKAACWAAWRCCWLSHCSIQRGFRIALASGDLFQRYLAGGISAYLALQAILIMAGNIRLLPITGVTLPFVSYGGSSLLTALLAAGLLLCIAIH